MSQENQLHIVKKIVKTNADIHRQQSSSVMPNTSSSSSMEVAPVWAALEQTGVQSFAYPDALREDLHGLFGFAPRRVLDVGCGSGAVGWGVKQVFTSAQVWGCELDERAAQIAQTRLDRVITVPLRQWSAPDTDALVHFDTILLLDVLEHMYNPWAEMQFLAQHLNADAQLIVSLPNVGHKSVLSALSKGDWPYASTGILDITHLRFFTEQTMLALFEQTGFNVMEKRYLTYRPVRVIENFPVRLNLGGCSILVRDEAHWMQLNSIQLGFRLQKRV